MDPLNGAFPNQFMSFLHYFENIKTVFFFIENYIYLRVLKEKETWNVHKFDCFVDSSD